MSYDLMVFDPTVAPRDREAFMAWYGSQTAWTEGSGYDDPAVTSEGLKAWYQAMRVLYPNMNGPDAADDDHRAADYSIGRHVIYAAFPWSLAKEVFADVRRLAVDCDVGFYDVSGDDGAGEIHFPGDALQPQRQHEDACVVDASVILQHILKSGS